MLVTRKHNKQIKCLVAVGETTHTTHYAENVVVNSVDVEGI